MSTLKIGDIVISLIDDSFEKNGIAYKSLIKGEKYKVMHIHQNATYPIELEPLSDPNVFVFASHDEVMLENHIGEKSEASNRYRVLGFTPDAKGGFLSKNETIFQCDSFADALDHLKNIHNENIECVYFTIHRGEWK